MNYWKNISWLFVPFYLFIILYILDIKYQCPWKTILNIPCPGCGMTRAVKLILQGQIIDSFQYNIMALPLVIITIISIVCLVIDIIKNQTTYINRIDKIVQKHMVLILSFVVVVWLFNILLNGKRL